MYLYHRRHEGKLHAKEGHPEEGSSMLLRNGTSLQRSTSSSPQSTCCLSSVIEKLGTAFSITLQHKSSNRMPVLITDHLVLMHSAQMSLLYRTAHAPPLGDCCLSTDGVYWFRIIHRMSSDNFPNSIKGLTCVT